VFSAPTAWQVTEILWAPGTTETFEIPEPTFCPSTLSIVTAMKLPGRKEKAHTLASAEIVACPLGVLELLELMICVAHAGKIIAAKTGERHFIKRKVYSPSSKHRFLGTSAIARTDSQTSFFSVFGDSGCPSPRGGRTPQEVTLPTSPMAKPIQPTVALTTFSQLSAIKTVPPAHNHQAIWFRFIRALVA
jgi:hypothetical protein